jgi:hypothetical protein
MFEICEGSRSVVVSTGTLMFKEFGEFAYRKE